MCRPISSAQSIICRTIDDSLRETSDIKTIIYRRSVGRVKIRIVHRRIISRMNVNSPHPTRIRIHYIISDHVSIWTVRAINSSKFLYDDISVLRRSRDKLLRVEMQRQSNNDQGKDFFHSVNILNLRRLWLLNFELTLLNFCHYPFLRFSSFQFFRF